MDNRIIQNGLQGQDHDVCIEEDRYFFFPETGPGEADLSIIWGNYNKCGSSYRIEREDYPWYVLEYVISGSGGFQTNSHKWQLNPGMIFGFAPHVKHSYWSDESDPMEKICIVFQCYDTSPLKATIDQITGQATFVSDPYHINNLFTNIIDEGLGKAPHSRMIINHLIKALILMIKRNICETKSYNHSYNSFIRCRDYIEQNVTGKIQVGEIARSCNMDSSYMSRLFRKYMDCTPNQYIRKILIENSITLLTEPALSIKEIAIQMGFSNPYHFSAFFKKAVHLSPSGFRKTRGIQDRD